MSAVNGRAARTAAALCVFLLGLYAAPKAAAAFRNVQEGTEAPGFQLRDLGGQEVALESFKGRKAVVLVFWATWSGRSLEELKDVQKLVAEYGEKGLAAVAVNVEHEHLGDEDLKGIKSKTAEMALSYPLLVDAGLETFRGYGVVAVPSTAILGEGAVLKASYNGYPSSVAAEVRAKVEALLGIKGEEAAVAAAPAFKMNRQALLNYNLGRRLYASGMADKAEGKLRTAAGADPAWAAPRILLGDIYLGKAKKDKSRAEDARKEFEAAVEAEKENVVARTGLARAKWRLGLAAEAEKDVGEAIALGKAYPPALLLKAAIVGKKGAAAEADALIREALELNPRDPESHALAGRAYEDGGKLEQAAASYRKAWELKGE